MIYSSARKIELLDLQNSKQNTKLKYLSEIITV